MSKENLRSMFWDYEIPYSAEDIYNFLIGEKEIGEFNRNQIISRMLITIRWYELVDIFGIQRLYGFLNDDVLQFVWKKSVKERYKNVRETLRRVL